MIDSAKSARALFQQLNRELFDGSLPDYKVEFVPIGGGVDPDEGDEGDEGEDWAWDEARDYHPCRVRWQIHLWRKLHPRIREEERDLRYHCGCEACKDWVARGSAASESLEDWCPWEPEGAPVSPHAKWIEARAFELVQEGQCVSELSA